MGSFKASDFADTVARKSELGLEPDRQGTVTPFAKIVLLSFLMPAAIR
jgi:hypothetical protein